MKISYYVAKEPFEDAGQWVLRELSKSLSAALGTCEHCKKAQMRPAIYVELRTLVQNEQMTKQEMEKACEEFCLGHRDEWIPEYVIEE